MPKVKMTFTMNEQTQRIQNTTKLATSITSRVFQSKLQALIPERKELLLNQSTKTARFTDFLYDNL